MPLNDSMDIILKQLDLWYRSVPGSYLLAAERVELEKYLSHYFGQHLLQIGGPSEFLLFEKSPIRHRVRLSPECTPIFHGPSVQGSLQDVPFLPESIDVILLPHVLEFVTNPEFLLQQIHAALVTDGWLAIVGFNPWSLWALAKWKQRPQQLPWCGRFRSVGQVRSWLLKQEFVIEEVRTFCFRPPLTSQRCLRKLLALEVMGRLLWPNCGGAYLIIAKKQVLPITPVRKSLFRKRVLMDDYLAPTARLRSNTSDLGLLNYFSSFIGKKALDE